MYSKMVLKFIALLAFCATTFAAEVGNDCTTPNGESATCVSLYDCDIIYKNLAQIPKNFLKESQCGYDKGPLVCCGTKKNYLSENETASRIIVNKFLPDKSECGIQFVFRIYGGQLTALEEFPWMALLMYRTSKGLQPFCAGSIISQRYVLTAAHCVTSNRYKDRPIIRLGEFNISSSVDCVKIFGFDICNDAPVDLGVAKTIVHNLYDANRRSNDIALIRLNASINYTDFIRPICLPDIDDVANTGEEVIVAGWGKTESAPGSQVKLKVKMPVVNASICQAVYKQSNNLISIEDTQVCAGGEPGADSCSGDSGGPLMSTTKNDNSKWYIEGIVSFGYTYCGTERSPGVYTKVNKYINWIFKNILP